MGQPYRYTQTSTGFAIDLDHLRSQITPATKVLIYNNLQNPLGCESSLDEMAELAQMARQHDLWVLSDEAYFEMRYSGTSTSIASLPEMQARTVILYTFSKKFAMTGWRLGSRRGARRADRPDHQDQHQRRELHDPLRAGCGCRGAAG